MKRIASRTNINEYDLSIAHGNDVDYALTTILYDRGVFAKCGTVQTQWRDFGLRHPQLSSMKVSKENGLLCNKLELKQSIETPLVQAIKDRTPEFGGTGKVVFRINNGEFEGLEIISK